MTTTLSSSDPPSPSSSESERAAVIAEQRSGPGIILLTSSFQTLYVDRRAWELCTEINRWQNGKTVNGVLPTVVTELCSEVLRTFQERTHVKDWEQFQIRRITGDPMRPVLLRGLALPDRGEIQQPRILIILEDIGRRQKGTPHQMKELFHLTAREQDVVQYLARGWTNKEIASALGISEQTVKEHIKRIMQKTNTSTRTGVLGQVLCA